MKRKSLFAGFPPKRMDDGERLDGKPEMREVEDI